MISTGVESVMPQSWGTSPCRRSHLVLQALPHGAPCSCGVKSWRMASAAGTGSSGSLPAAELQRYGPAVNGRKNAFPNESIETLFSDPAVVVQ